MWSRRNAIVSALPTAFWPQVIEAEIDERRLERYRSQADAMRMYFANEPVKKIEKVTGVSRTVLPELARKCLLLSHDGSILGFRALLPYTRIKEYVRVAAIKEKFPEMKGGYAGALGALLTRFPDVEDVLVKYIRQDAKLKLIPEFKLRPRDLHRLFIRILKDKGVEENEWPFNTKFRGIRSIERYMKRVLDRNFARSVATREGQVAKAHLNVGTGVERFLTYDQPYDAVEIDAYKIESHLSVAFRTPEGTETELLLERLWLISAIEQFSTAILAYTVVYRSEVTADDVLRVIRDAATKKWVPLDLTFPALSYPPKGGLPSGVVPGAHGAVWTATLFDGALAHLSKAVYERARKTVSFAINWGPVGHFERRANVERSFNQIGKDIFRRLPSTTGSHPHNGRAKNAQEKAVRHHIRAADAEQLLDVAIAQHNATPSEGISYLSPLDTLKYFLADPDQPYLVRYLPTREHEAAKTFASREEVTVRGQFKTGRRPYVQIDRVHYSSPVLANAGHLIGRALIVEIDEEDMRQVRAFLKNGAELGFLKAHGKWSLTKHSRRTRKAINSLAYQRVITISEFDDPVQIYLRHLSQRNPDKTVGSRALSPRQVTEVTRVAKDAGLHPQIFPSQPADPHPPDREAQARNSLLDSPGNFFNKVKNRR